MRTSQKVLFLNRKNADFGAQYAASTRTHKHTENEIEASFEGDTANVISHMSAWVTAFKSGLWNRFLIGLWPSLS